MRISGIAVVSSIAIPETVSLSTLQLRVSHTTTQVCAACCLLVGPLSVGYLFGLTDSLLSQRYEGVLFMVIVLCDQ